MLGRRIAVYGPSGSGKTTLSRELGLARGLPVIELDSIFHKPNWTPTPDDQFIAEVNERLQNAPDGWVIDGNYRVIRAVVMPRATDIVWVRLPFWTVYPRLFLRTVTRGWRKEPLWNTNYESLRLAFMSRDSMLLWGIHHWRAHHRGVERSIRETRPPGRIHVLRSPEAVKRFANEAASRPIPSAGSTS